MLSLQNPFWIDTTTCCSEYCENIDIEGVQHILDSPLWYNKKLISAQNFYISDWHKQGIRYISDLFDENGDLFEFGMLKNRYDLRGTFLDYQSVIRKIPKT